VCQISNLKYKKMKKILINLLKKLQVVSNKQQTHGTYPNYSELNLLHSLAYKKKAPAGEGVAGVG
jgi:hypothetical protein